MKIESIKIDKLLLDPTNARLHTSKNLDAIKASLKRFEQVEPLVVQKSTNVVIGGNGRLTAARELGITELDVHYVDVDNTTAKALALALNRTAETASWNMDVLGDQLQGLLEDDWDLGELGFDTGDLDDFLKDEHGGSEGHTDPDDIPEVVEPVCKSGQIWKLGEHRVMCGDSTSKEDVERLMDGEKADMVFTDPPYGVDYHGSHVGLYRNGDNSNISKQRIQNDKNTDLFFPMFKIIKESVVGPCYVFCGAGKEYDVLASMKELSLDVISTLIWRKDNRSTALNANYKPVFEMFYYFVVGKNRRWLGAHDQRTCWDIKRNNKNEFHPTQKPIDLIEKAISNHEAYKVLDLFLGSGSTLIACEKTGRKCYGMEIDPHYCDVIIKRWSDFSGETAELIDG